MTTICYRSGVLASDSRLTIDESVNTDKCKKLWRLPDGSLFAFSGENEPGLLLLASLRKGDPPQQRPGEKQYDAIRILPKGQIYYTEGLRWNRWPEKFISIGTGGSFARAAMLAGASAPEAVKIAIASDVFSGGRIQILRLKR